MSEANRRMKVFIGWGGEQSKHVARALRDWLPRVNQFVEPWLSESDIGKGSDWLLELRKQLEKTYFGIVCLTPENLENPWMHFETGALAKNVTSSKVFPLLYKVKKTDLNAPLSIFQATNVNMEEMLEMMLSINESLGIDALEREILTESFSRRWEDFEKEIKKTPKTKSPPPKKTEQEKTDETLEAIRRMERRLTQFTTLPRISGARIGEAQVSAEDSLIETRRLGIEIQHLLDTLTEFSGGPVFLDDYDLIRRFLNRLTRTAFYDFDDMLRTVNPVNRKKAFTEIKRILELREPTRLAYNNIASVLGALSKTE